VLLCVLLPSALSRTILDVIGFHDGIKVTMREKLKIESHVGSLIAVLFHRGAINQK